MQSPSPMMRQYNSMKKKYPGTILFFRLGDFYEMFDDDAKLVSGLLGLTLTARDSGEGKRAPMCGVPYHAASAYIQKLIDRGYKVAICEQISDPALSRGLVEREVVRIVTPGTVIASDDSEARVSRYIMCLIIQKKKIGAAYANVSTGEFNAFELSDTEQLSDALAVLNVAEIIASAETLTEAKLHSVLDGISITDYDHAEPTQLTANKILSGVFGDADAAPDIQPIQTLQLACRASAGLISYIMETQKAGMTHITKIGIVDFSLEMAIDRTARRNLELAESLSGERGRSLLSILDKTVTASGSRTLRTWIQHPLSVIDRITARHDAVGYFFGNTDALGEIQGMLKGSADLARLLSKLSYRTLTPRDCLALERTLSKAAQLKQTLAALADAPQLIRQIADKIAPLGDLISLIERMISPDATQSVSDGGAILAGYSDELDELRAVGSDGLAWMEKLEAKERQETGIKNLKIVYNRVFGYLFEVTKSFADKVPAYFIRKQTLTTGERYTTLELADLERKIIGSRDKAQKLEEQLFSVLRDYISGYARQIASSSDALETVDVLCALALAAVENQYARASLNGNGMIKITAGRHPVVETMLGGSFIPNDTLIDMNERFQIITGPNMSGKSTYMRQVALIVIMNQIGGFVPADSADLCVVDKLFTRVGASDDLASGQSTFMVEMKEMANILSHATPNSLILLDEIGRGTATFDGLAIAWAIAEYMSDTQKLGAKTLFATHYHELAELEGKLPGVVNYYVKVKLQGEEILFLRKIERGNAGASFGVHVARLAGLPRAVVQRAASILAKVEAQTHGRHSISKNILGQDKQTKASQIQLGDSDRTEFIEYARSINVLAMNPIEAQTELFRIHERALRL